MATQVAARPSARVAAKPVHSVEELPGLGSMLAFNDDRLNFLLGLSRSCGDVGRFHFGPFPMLFCNSSELVHSVLVEHAADFDVGAVRHHAFGSVTGNGLLVSEGELHRRQRKAMAPAFQPRHIKSYADIMVSYAERAQASWRDGAEVDVDREMTHMTMSIIGKVLFDADVFTEADSLGAAVKVAIDHINYVFTHLLPVPLGWPLPRHQRTREALAFLRARTQEMIDERRRHPEQRDDFLSILLRTRDEDGNPMSDQQVHDEAMTLFGAGHETTATALTWTWYLLAQHPDVYQRLCAEVDEVLRGRAPTYDDLARLPYTLQVLKEAMRLYPPVSVLSRVALRDVEIGGHPLRKGETALISPHALHRRALYFPDPDRFDPDRFTPEREARLPRYAYMPFGAGPRICIGNYFALMEGHLLLAALARQVTFELVPGQTIVPEPKVTTRPHRGIQLLVHRRQQRPA